MSLKLTTQICIFIGVFASVFIGWLIVFITMKVLKRILSNKSAGSRQADPPPEYELVMRSPEVYTVVSSGGLNPVAVQAEMTENNTSEDMETALPPPEDVPDYSWVIKQGLLSGCAFNRLENTQGSHSLSIDRRISHPTTLNGLNIEELRAENILQNTTTTHGSCTLSRYNFTSSTPNTSCQKRVAHNRLAIESTAPVSSCSDTQTTQASFGTEQENKDGAGCAARRYNPDNCPKKKFQKQLCGSDLNQKHKTNSQIDSLNITINRPVIGCPPPLYSPS